jgi:hypothetical protein
MKSFLDTKINILYELYRAGWLTTIAFSLQERSKDLFRPCDGDVIVTPFIEHLLSTREENSRERCYLLEMIVLTRTLVHHKQYLPPLYKEFLETYQVVNYQPHEETFVFLYGLIGAPVEDICSKHTYTAENRGELFLLALEKGTFMTDANLGLVHTLMTGHLPFSFAPLHERWKAIFRQSRFPDMSIRRLRHLYITILLTGVCNGTLASTSSSLRILPIELIRLLMCDYLSPYGFR